MKNQLLYTAIAACLAVALAAPIAAPAVSPAGTHKTGNSAQQSPPEDERTKNGRGIIPGRPDQPDTIAPETAPPPTTPRNSNFMAPAARVSRVPLLTTFQRQPDASRIADHEVCLFQNANFTGWKFCTNIRELQTLPALYQRQLTSIKIPGGYLLMLYRNPDKTGGTCVFYGEVAQVARDCDNMATAISFDPDPEWPRKQAEARRQREREEDEHARQVREAERLAIVERERAVQEAQAAQAAREASERERAAAQARRERELEAARQADWDQVRTATGECLISMDKGYVFGGSSNRRCFNVTSRYTGNDWNDEVVKVNVHHSRGEVILYEGANFEGRSIRLTCGFYILADAVEDQVSSFKISVLPRPAACPMGDRRITRWDN